MNSYLKQHAKLSRGAMKTGDHFRNGGKPCSNKGGFTMKKQFCFLAICIFMILSVNVQLNAQSVSAQEVLNDLNSKIGQCIDMDGYYGCQCVDIAKYVCINFFNKEIKGNANVLDNTDKWPDGTEIFYYYTGFVPQPGDFFIYEGSSYPTGHIGIVESATASGFVGIEQNWYNPSSTSGSPLAQVPNHSYNQFHCVMRLPYNNCPGTTINVVGPITATEYPSGEANTWVHGKNKRIAFSLKNISDCTIPRAFKLFLTDRQDNEVAIVWEQEITFAPGQTRNYDFDGGPVSKAQGNYRLVLKAGPGSLFDITMNSSTVACQSFSDCSNPVDIRIIEDGGNGTDTYFNISTSSNPSVGGTTSGGNSYASGASCTVRATANSGYTFSNWTQSGSVVSTSTNYTFTVTSNRTLVANFTQNSSGVTCTTPPSYDLALTAPTTSWQTESYHTNGGGDCYVYRVAVTAGTKYTFKTGCGNGANAGFDTKLYLYNNSGNLLTSNDDGCASNGGDIIEDYEINYTGVAYLQIKGATSASYGNYTLAYKKESATTAPVNDLCADATNLSCGTTTNGTMDGATPTAGYQQSNKNDVFYKFTAVNDGDYTITLNNFSGDKDMYLYSSCSNTTLLEVTESSSSIETITHPCTAGTTYRIRITDYNGSGGTFKIKVDCPTTTQNGCTSGNQYPNNHTFSPSCTGTDEVISTYCYAGEYSLVALSAGNTYTFSSSVGSDFITITNQSGTSILATGTGSVISYANVSTTVRFYTHTNSSCGTENEDRSRMVRCGNSTPTAPVNDLCGDATNLSCGTTTNGTMDGATPTAGYQQSNKNDVFYKFTAVNEGDYTITLDNFSGDLELFLYENCNTTGDLQISTTNNSTETVTHYCTSGTTYRIRITDYDGTGGTFGIKVTCPATGDAYEYNNTEATAYNLGVNFSGNSATINTNGADFHSSGDIDYYKIVLSEGYNYTITPRLHDSYASDNGQTYTVDAKFSYYSPDNGLWSDTYDTHAGSFTATNGGTLYFKVEPYTTGNMGTYLLAINVTKATEHSVGGNSTITLNSNNLPCADAALQISGTGFTPNKYAAINLNGSGSSIKERVEITSDGTFTITYSAFGYRVGNTPANVYVADMTVAGMADNSWSYTELSSLPNNIVLHETVTIDNGTCVATTGITLNKTTTTILVNGMEELTATVTPPNATNKSVTWSSSNTSVATVNNGIVTGIAAGTATITVTTVDGNITTCVVTVMSSDATLKSLIVSSGSLSFDANTTNYTVNVGNDVTSINITGTANNTAARVTGNVTGKALDIGDNVITITVTAEDGTTTKAYTVTIVRVASSDASLKSLTVSSGTLSFDANTTDYTVNVSNEVTNIDVTGTANHVNATVTGNIAGKVLNTGNNEIKITVTAEDGVTTKTYTVTVVYENAAIILNAFSLNNNVNIALSSTVDLVYNFSGGVPTEYIAGEKPDLSGSQWKTYNPAKLTYSFESGEYGIKTVYTRLRNDKGETGIMSDVIYYKPFYEISIDSFDDNYDQTRSIIGSLYDKSVSVYPNPVEIYANVIIDNIESPAGKVEIYSLTGAMYLSQEFTGSKFSIDMSRCPSGIFLIKLTVGDVQVTKRIIKL